MRKILSLVVGLFLACNVHAATFSLFSPATGILKGSSSTYVTTAASSTDILGLFTGTCTSATFVRGDGTCNLVNLTSNVTGILPAANGGTANGFAAFTGPATSTKTFTLPNATATILTSNAAVTVAQGGTGVATLTGIVKASGTSNFSAAVASDIVGLFSACSGSQYLGADGACHNAGGAGTVQSVALTAPAIFSVTGSPVTTTGTLAIAATGTSGGIPYFDSSTSLASSSALLANRIVLGGGAAVAPTSLGSLGTTTTLLHGNAAGAPTFGAVSLSADVTGTLADGSLSANVPLLNASNTFTGATQSQTLSTNGPDRTTITNSSTGTSAQSFFSLVNASHTAFVGLAGTAYSTTEWTGGPTGEQFFIGVTGNVPLSIATNAVERIRLAGDGSIINLQATAVQVNGANLPRMAWGKVNGVAGCAISNSTGLTTPCTRNSAGNYSITHSPALSTNTSCTVTSDTTTSTITQTLSASNGTTLTVLTNVGAVATDAVFSVICMSN